MHLMVKAWDKLLLVVWMERYAQGPPEAAPCRAGDAGRTPGPEPSTSTLPSTRDLDMHISFVHLSKCGLFGQIVICSLCVAS